LLFDDTASDSVDEGDIGLPRMSGDRKALVAGSYVDDTAFTPANANSYVVMMGAQADETATDSVDEGDVGAVRMNTDRVLWTRQHPITTATLTNVNDSGTSATLLASTPTRKGAVIVNDSTVALYIKYGATASATSFTYKIAAAATWEMPVGNIYTGIIDGIWDSDQSGAARITELT
jgi:hypothetical protein